MHARKPTSKLVAGRVKRSGGAPIPIPSATSCPFCDYAKEFAIDEDISKLMQKNSLCIGWSEREHLLVVPSTVQHWLDQSAVTDLHEMQRTLLKSALLLTDWLAQTHSAEPFGNKQMHRFSVNTGKWMGQITPHLHLRFDTHDGEGVLTGPQWINRARK